MKSICVYCGSSPGSEPVFADAARAVGQVMAGRGMRLVYGGGNVGMMGILADASLDAGGEVVGVIPHHLADKELAHPGATQMLRVGSMHERKQRMADISDGFIALPGGIGTLEELFETMTWLQLGLHTKPIGLLNVAGFWDTMLRFLDEMVATRYLKPEHRALLLVAESIDDLLAQMADFSPPDSGKWLDSVKAEALR